VVWLVGNGLFVQASRLHHGRNKEEADSRAIVVPLDALQRAFRTRILWEIRD